MSSPAIDLLMRVIAEQLRAENCPRCGSTLAGAPIAVRDSNGDEVVFEAGCRACDRIFVLQVKPGADGVVRIA